MYHIFLVENCDEKYIKITKERGRIRMENGIEKNFTKLTHKRGISLIVLIVTIIVIITKNNPVESAKEATFKEDVRNFQDELARTVVKE